MKALSILGSTGSIGKNTLAVVARFPELFTVKALTAKNSTALLAEQIVLFQPELAVVYDAAAAAALKPLLPGRCRTEVLYGPDGYRAAACLAGVDIVVAAMVGAAGLDPVLAAIEAGKQIALANKETLVMAGAVVTAAARRNNVRLMPIDSEHSAIFQCLQGQRRADLDKIILTASGGALLRTPVRNFSAITPQQALKHPNWNMGAKITIDSATLMNKGLEVIEARWLFDLDKDQIEVVIHPQSIVHSMVAFKDGSVLAQLGLPDMRAAIAYALSCPQRLPLGLPAPDFTELGNLTFEAPDYERFPCLVLALDVCRAGGTLPAVMNAANEVAVNAFLSEKLPFVGIAELVKATVMAHTLQSQPDLQSILAADAWAREFAQCRLEESGIID